MSSSLLPAASAAQPVASGTVDNAVTVIEGNLASAAAKLRSARVRVASARGWERAAVLLAATGAASAVAITVSRLSGVGAAWVWGLAALGVAASAATFLSAVYPAWSATPSLDEVAERLDLATADKNRIATALNLARAAERSPFITCAISDGLAAVQKLSASEPAVPAAATSGQRTWALVGGGALLAALSLLVPLHRILPSAADTAPSALALAKPAPRGSEQHPPRKLEDKHTPPENPEPGERSPLEAAANPNGSKQNAPSASSASAAMSSSAAGAAPESTAASNAGAKEKQQDQGNSPKENPKDQSAGATPQPNNKSAQLGDSGKTSADSRSKPGSFQGGTRAEQVPNAQNPQDATPNENSAENSAGGSPPPGTESDENGSGNSPGDGKKGQGAGQSDATSDGEGGDGQSSGQNQPKKSRGVAPLMLGTREPDLFQGRQLAGPDERTKLQVPPRASPGQPRPDAAAAPRTGDEQVVPGYRVPASMQRLVSDYFQKYHAEGQSSAAPADSKAADSKAADNKPAASGTN